MRIYLIGFMGCGKTTFGKKLANKLEYKFLDLDKKIEKLEKQSIANTFSEKGEEYFRQLEADVLRSTILYKNAVISCGGGTPCLHNNMQWMNSRGITIYLKTSAEHLTGRLKTRKEKRPLIATMSDDELWDFVSIKLPEREKYYLQAQIIADTKEKLSAKKIVDLIEGKIESSTESA
jgi:shikimate kinase